MKPMRTVVAAQEATESRGEMRNGVLVSAQIWKVWVCTLECGHKTKRRYLDAPKRARCKLCPQEE